MNAKSKNWWREGDSNPCGVDLCSISTTSGYSQLIKEPTNFDPNKRPSCIDLIFVDQPNLVTESGVHPSLCKVCHHQIIFAKLSFKTYSCLPPMKERSGITIGHELTLLEGA